MGYLFLLASLITGATKGYCGKRTSGYVNEYKDAMLVNAIRMMLCIFIGLGMIVFGGKTKFLHINSTILAVSLLSGVANATFVVLWLVAVKRGAYMMLDVFCMLGILIPLIGCAVFLGETIRLNHIVGMGILFIAVCIMCSYNNSIKSKLTISSLAVLLLCGISNGFLDFSQKLFTKISQGVPIAVFNFYTYIFSTAILSVCCFVCWKNSDNKTLINIKPIFLYILIMSVCLFLYSYFKTLAARYLSSAQLYPLSQSGSLILSTMMSAALFHERLNIKCVVGIALSFVALIVINVL